MNDKPVNPFLKLLTTKPVVASAPTTAKPADKPDSSRLAMGLKTLMEQGKSTSANPLLSLNAPPPPPEPASLTTNGIAAESVHELANVNTDLLVPNDGRPSPNIAVKAANRTQALALTTGEEVRALCDRVDELIESNDQLAGPPLFELRNHVQRLMVTLKERPEFDGIVLDKDIRNVMKFIRATREEALQLREIKTEKKSVRAVKKESTTKANKGMEAAFAAILGGGKLKL